MSDTEAATATDEAEGQDETETTVEPSAVSDAGDEQEETADESAEDGTDEPDAETEGSGPETDPPSDETNAAEDETASEEDEDSEGHDLQTKAGRLAQAIETYGPGDHSLREFHRAVRHHVQGVTGSFHAVRGYLEDGRFIPDAFLDRAAKVLGPVTAQWLMTGEEGEPDDEGEPDESAVDAEDGEPTDANGPSDVSESDPWADIRNAVSAAGAKPGSEALQKLDPGFPRRGQSVRNWAILRNVVLGKAVAEVAEEVGLSAKRITEICDEYAELVRQATGG